MLRRLFWIALLCLVTAGAVAAPARTITLVGRNDLRFSKSHLVVPRDRRSP